MVADTHAWWTLLRAVSVFNIVAWLFAAAWLVRRARTGGDTSLWPSWRWQLLLSAGYVAGCAWRSLLPVYDVPRLVLVDSWWSSVLVGRSVATFAELCFAAQWALMLRDAGHAAGSRFAATAWRFVVPTIALAECWSWYSVLTTSNLGHVIEESLWGLTAVLVAAGIVAMWPRVEPGFRPLLAFWGAASTVYVGYMFGVDVPMYWSRWLADEMHGRDYLGLAQGLADVSTRWVVSHRWDDWKSEVTWMSLYFSAAVWLSIGLACMRPSGGTASSAQREPALVTQPSQQSATFASYRAQAVPSPALSTHAGKRRGA